MSLAISAALSVSSTAVIADNTGRKYIGMQYAVGIFPVGDQQQEHPNARLFKGGKYFSDSFALESRIGSGSGRNEVGQNQTLGLENLLGVYGVKHFNISEASSVYSVIGASFVRMEVEEYKSGEQICIPIPVGDPGGGGRLCSEGDRTIISSASDNGVGLSFGVGADIGITDNASLNIEYMQYLNQSTFVYDTIGIGLNYIF